MARDGKGLPSFYSRLKGHNSDSDDGEDDGGEDEQRHAAPVRARSISASTSAAVASTSSSNPFSPARSRPAQPAPAGSPFDPFGLGSACTVSSSHARNPTLAQLQHLHLDDDKFGVFQSAPDSPLSQQPRHEGQEGGESIIHTPPVACSPQSTLSPPSAASTPGHDMGQRRELILYALPLLKDRLVYLPVSGWVDDDVPKEGVKKAISERIDKMQGAAADAWAEMKEKEPDTLGHKLFKLGNRVLQNQSPEDRLMRNIPKNVNKVIIYHPAAISPEIVMQELTTKSSSIGFRSTAKAALAGLMLPIAFGIDIIVIPGPQVLTYYTLYEMWKNGKNAMGGARLTKYIAQDGEDNQVRVNYAGDPRLDRYLAAVQEGGAEGVLGEDDVEAMVVDLHEHSLLEPLLALRERHLRRKGARKGGDKYHALASHDPVASSEAFGSHGGQGQYGAAADARAAQQ